MRSPVVKICGVTSPSDGAACARAGADWIGLNFWPRSKRAVDRDEARAIAAAIRNERAGVNIVGVFVNEDPAVVAATAEEVGLERIQLHGDESTREIEAHGDRAIAAVRISGPGDVGRAATMPAGAVVLVDAPAPGYGGSGTVADWELARQIASFRQVILAGGLSPENVGGAILFVRPFGVDVASGVESSPGKKDPDRVKAFVEAAKSAMR